MLSDSLKKLLVLNSSDIASDSLTGAWMDDIAHKTCWCVYTFSAVHQQHDSGLSELQTIGHITNYQLFLKQETRDA